MTIDQKQVLKDLINMNSIDILVENLNISGIISCDKINDNNDFFISSHIINHWTDEATDYLYTKGYIGGEIGHIGKFIESYGNYLVLFDQNKYDYFDAVNYIKKATDKYMYKDYQLKNTI